MKSFCGGKIRFALRPPPTGAMPAEVFVPTLVASGVLFVVIISWPPAASCGFIGWLSVGSTGNFSFFEAGLKNVFGFCAMRGVASLGGASSAPLRPQPVSAVRRMKQVIMQRDEDILNTFIGVSVEYYLNKLPLIRPSDTFSLKGRRKRHRMR